MSISIVIIMNLVFAGLVAALVAFICNYRRKLPLSDEDNRDFWIPLAYVHDHNFAVPRQIGGPRLPECLYDPFEKAVYLQNYRVCITSGNSSDLGIDSGDIIAATYSLPNSLECGDLVLVRNAYGNYVIRKVYSPVSLKGINENVVVSLCSNNSQEAENICVYDIEGVIVYRFSSPLKRL